MICETFNRQLEDFTDKQLEPTQQDLFELHLAGCEHCRATLAEQRQYLRAMRAFKVPEPGPGQLAHMLRDAHLKGEATMAQRSPRRSFIRGFAAASLLAVVALAAQWQIYNGAPGTTGPAALATIAEHAFSRQVTVVINVPADMPAANLTLDFPETLRMEGLEDLPRVAWSVDLEQGANVLMLPVTVAAGTDLARSLSIQATVSYEDKQKEFELPVELLSATFPRHGALFDGDELPTYHI